jgi:hypothetical protein
MSWFAPRSYYSKEDIEMIMPMVRADIAQIRASSESFRALGA